MTGLVGVILGAEASRRYKKVNPRAEPLICAASLLAAASCLYLALILAPTTLLASYVYARLVLGATGGVPGGAAVHPSVPDLGRADVDVGDGAAVGERVLAGAHAGRVPGHGLVVQGPGDGGRRGALGGAHEGEGLAWDDHALAEGRHYSGRAVWGGWGGVGQGGAGWGAHTFQNLETVALETGYPHQS